MNIDRTHRPNRPARRRALAVGLLALVLLAATACQPGGPGTEPTVKAPPKSSTATWQYQLQGTVDESVAADVFVIDGFDTPASKVASLKRSGRYVVCYLSTSFEDWRSDASRFPAEAKGNPLDGWPGERWIDIRDLESLLPIFVARVDMCRDKGFDAVEFDNVDAYTQRTGFSISGSDQLRFNRLMAAVARSRGLAAALKNDTDQVRDLVDHFDFAIVEECVTWNECAAYRPFVDRGKSVFVVEYERSLAQLCTATRPLGFAGIVKTYDLKAKPWSAC